MRTAECPNCGTPLPSGQPLCSECQEKRTGKQRASFPHRSFFVKQWFSRRIFLSGTAASILSLFTSPWSRIHAASRPMQMPTTSMPVQLNFESGNLSSWIAEGQTFLHQPILGDKFTTSQVKPGLIPLGGDYWDGPHPVGNMGNYWISTEDALTGTLTSQEFTLDETLPWFSFLIGGNADSAACRVELLIKATPANAAKFANMAGKGDTYPLVTLANRGKFYRVYQASGQGPEVMRRESQQIGWLAGERACIRIVDQSTTGHINVDDFRFSADAPQVVPLTEGGGDPSAPVWGMADTHTHPTAHLAFGGYIFWGQQDGPIDTALAHCTPDHGPDGTGLFTRAGALVALFEQVGYGTDIGHPVGGYPEFDGWPKFTTLIHQQMYVDWIRRAYEGGLRLVVAHAVNNEMLANQFGGQQPYDDKYVVELQIVAMKDFVSRHTDWMEIAYSPADARRIIRENKLAIVLGIEVDSLGNFGDAKTCSDADVLMYLNSIYHDLGVRHLFPVHIANNAFGGTAIYNELFNVSNHFLRNSYFQVEDGSASGVQFRLGDDTSLAILFSQILGGYNPPDYSKVPGGHINVASLTAHGNFLIHAMMSMGMIIDIDHMSQKAVDATLDLVEQHDYPVVFGHTGFRELAWKRDTETANVHKCAHEMLKTATQIERVRKLGGIISPLANQGDIRDVGDVVPILKGKVPDDCAGSSKTWAQAYLYAVEKMGGQGVGIGTDTNGLAKDPCPRFGLNAAYDLDYDITGTGTDAKRRSRRAQQVPAQQNGVKYDKPLVDARHYRFEGVLEDDIYDDLDRDAWQAVGLYKAGLNPWQNHDIPDINDRVENFAKGFWATSDGQLQRPPDGDAPWEQRAAFLVKTGQQPGNPDRDPQRVHEIYPHVLAIWQRWQTMDGTNTPLTRSYAGQRDFDINLDGVAHYGMIPDLLQDLKNVGLTDEDLKPLFRSAEDYIRMWEKCELRSQNSKLKALT